MSTLDIYNAFEEKNKQSERRSSLFSLYTIVSFVILVSAVVVLADNSSKNAPTKVKKYSGDIAIDSQLTVPNTDGWLPPEKVRELSYE